MPAAETSLPTFDSIRFRQVLGCFPTGVAVITSADESGPVGLAVGSFTSVSLDPPLVGFFPSKTSTSWPRIQRTGQFVANILADHQEGISRTFAASGGDKFADIRWHAASNGAPVIEGVAAWIECDVDQIADAGDHLCVLGRVRHLAAETAAQSAPLVFFKGKYGRLSGEHIA
jgi:3-hydroxy-9,10-secoandrosta-1,3,5(10)-triene-9,17-dione monooxygenase reductase component